MQMYTSLWLVGRKRSILETADHFVCMGSMTLQTFVYVSHFILSCAYLPHPVWTFRQQSSLQCVVPLNSLLAHVLFSLKMQASFRTLDTCHATTLLHHFRHQCHCIPSFLSNPDTSLETCLPSCPMASLLIPCCPIHLTRYPSRY